MCASRGYLGCVDTYYAHAFGQNKPKCKARRRSNSETIDRSRNAAVGFVLAKPFGLRQLFGKFQFFCFADTSLYPCRKKTKISSKILAAHARNMCQHTLVVTLRPAAVRRVFRCLYGTAH